jgi:hypothetical protein
MRTIFLSVVGSALADDLYEPGFYHIRFDGKGMPSGVYFYRLEGSGWSQTRRMVLLK